MTHRSDRLINILFIAAFVANLIVACRSGNSLPTSTAQVSDTSATGAVPAVMPVATAAAPDEAQLQADFVRVPDNALPEEVFELGYWPAERMWLLLRNDNDVIGIPEGQEGNPDAWYVLRRAGTPTQSAAVRAAQLSDGRLAVALLGVRAERTGEGNGVGVLADGWRFFPAPEGTDDVMGLAALPDNRLLVAFASSLWILDVDAEKWRPFDSLPDGFEGPVYEVAVGDSYLYLSGPQAGIWLKTGNQWAQIVRGGTGNTGQGHLYVSHIEAVGNRLYFVQDGALRAASADGQWIEDIRLELPANEDWVRLMAAGERGFLYQVGGRIYHRSVEGATTLVLDRPDKSSGAGRAFGLAKPALWTAWPVPGSWCDPGRWASEPKMGMDAIEYIIETSPRLTWLYEHKRHTFETVPIGPGTWIPAGSIASQGSQCGAKQLFIILDAPGWNVPANNYCSMWENALANSVAWRVIVPLTHNPPQLTLNSVLPGVGPLVEEANITVNAFGRDDHRIYQPNWTPGWDRLELRYYINAATDGTASGAWWEFARVPGAGQGWTTNAAGEMMGEPAISKNGVLNWAVAPAWMPRTGRHLVVVNLYAIDTIGGQQAAAIWNDAPATRSTIVEWIAPTPTWTPTAIATQLPTATPFAAIHSRDDGGAGQPRDMAPVREGGPGVQILSWVNSVTDWLFPKTVTSAAYPRAGVMIQPDPNEIVVGVTPAPGGGSVIVDGSRVGYVWDSWDTGGRDVTFILATMTPTLTPTPTSTPASTPAPTPTNTPTNTPTPTATPIPSWSGSSVETEGTPLIGAAVELRGRYDDCLGDTGDMLIASTLTAADGSFSLSAAIPLAPGCGWQNIAAVLSLPWSSSYRPFSASAPAPGWAFSASEIRYPGGTSTGTYGPIQFVVEPIPVSVGAFADYPYLVLRGPEIPPPSGPLPAQVVRGSYAGPLPLGGRQVRVHIWDGSAWTEYTVFTDAAGDWLLTPAFAGEPLLGTTLLGSWQAYAEIAVSGSGIYVSPDAFWRVSWFPVHATR